MMMKALIKAELAKEKPATKEEAALLARAMAAAGLDEKKVQTAGDLVAAEYPTWASTVLGLRAGAVPDLLSSEQHGLMYLQPEAGQLVHTGINLFNYPAKLAREQVGCPYAQTAAAAGECVPPPACACKNGRCAPSCALGASNFLLLAN